MKAPVPAATLLADLRAELDRGHVTEVELVNPLEHIDGLCDHGSQRIYVNPKPAVVETLLHELLHRRWPGWSERRVDREAKRLFCGLTTREVNAWYRRYQAIARKRRTPKRVEDE